MRVIGVSIKRARAIIPATFITFIVTLDLAGRRYPPLKERNGFMLARYCDEIAELGEQYQRNMYVWHGRNFVPPSRVYFRAYRDFEPSGSSVTETKIVAVYERAA